MDHDTLHYPLTSTQQAVWLDQLLTPEVPRYNIGVAGQLDGPLDLDLFEAAIRHVVADHDALRLVLVEELTGARQQFLSQLDFSLPRFDFTMHADAHERAWAHLRGAFSAPFALYGQPLWRMQWMQVDASRGFWLLCFHHLVADGLSISLVANAVVEAYNKLTRGDSACVDTDGTPSYRQFIAQDEDYLSSPRYEQDRQFWLDRFAQLPEPLFPDAHKHIDKPAGQAVLRLKREVFSRLTDTAISLGCSSSDFLIALLAILFTRLAHDCDEVVIGLALHGRHGAQQRRTVGMFASVMPVRIRVDFSQSFEQAARDVAAEVKRCYRHRRFQLADMKRHLQAAAGMPRPNLLDMVLSVKSFQGDLGFESGIQSTAMHLHSGYVSHGLEIFVRDYEKQKHVHLEFNFDASVFALHEVEALLARMERLITHALAVPQSPIYELPLLGEAERQQVLHGFNDTRREYPKHALIHELFEEQAERTPQATAVQFEDERLSYAELNTRANQLAHHLRSLGVGPDERVAICLERSVEMVVGLLAILKAGGAYVPIEPSYPSERIAHRLDDAAAPVLLTRASLLDRLPASTAHRVCLDADAPPWQGLPQTNPQRVGSSEDLAYVIYTSGSTGGPKGAMNAHAGVVNRLHWMQSAYPLSNADRVLQKTPFSFDVSVWEFFWTLGQGATLVLARPEGHKEPAYLGQLIADAGITVAHFVPSMLQVFLDAQAGAAASPLRHVICSGEALPTRLSQRFHQAVPETALHNLYGPTECAIDVTAWSCRSDEHRAMAPIGRPIANTRIYILDTQRQPVPIGVAGELYIAGVQVGRGYLNRPELTAERFMADPFASESGARMYKTGDLGRWLPEGNIEFRYQAVSEGRRYPGMEHWLPLFHDHLDTLFDYLPGTPVVVEPLAEDAARERFAQIADYYEARTQNMAPAAHSAAGAPYKPLPPDRLYLAEAEWRERLDEARLVRLTPFAAPEGTASVLDAGTRQGRNFAPERTQPDANVFEAVKAHVDALQSAGKRVVFAVWSDGARDRMSHVLADHKILNLTAVDNWPAMLALPRPQVGLAVLGLESGFETDGLAVIGEQDILGDRLVRPRKAAKRAENFIAEVSSLAAGDLVVHVDHGVGRFVGLKTIEAAGAPHDCLEIHYAGNDKLFLPVENIELLSRYGSEETAVDLDRLGGGAWQARKARMKARILEMAADLIKVAAERHLREAPRFTVGHGIYDEFCAGFPYDETDDQRSAIEAVLDDLASGRPMDRLICGDVGFGKTEVALRAAFVVALTGKQVAVVVPTTLLARQHFKTFSERFRSFPVQVAQASRLVGTAELARVRKGLADGTIDIVIGTHALLGKAIKFRDLGLLVVDEEQHFGVGHKERLKTLRAEVHVLTLTATPIPRTLQLALTGVRELSIIASPPVDRLTVRTSVAPFDPLIVREALLRERYRGGQSFYVCPRIEDLAGVKDYLDKHVPEARVAVAHGQMPPTVLEDVMAAFYDGKYDVLLSTTIIESGLDIPTANTLIVHRADMFGLAQLYQLRGRVGRSKTRAYALLTLPVGRKITAQAERRLKVLQSLDMLGAGFQLASHDLDIRGAGNLLGEEQSGHIKEVGFELYQQMLEEAVASLKAGIAEPVADRWSPQITIGTPVLIPEDYVADLSVRLSLYRRLADLDEERDIDAFGAEMIDRFGPLPPEVRHLLDTVVVKALCRRANVAKIEAGPKGAVVSFRDDRFANPEGLIAYIHKQGREARVRPDMKVVFFADWEQPEDRLKGAARILRALVGIAERAKAA